MEFNFRVCNSYVKIILQGLAKAIIYHYQSRLAGCKQAQNA